jgi:protein-tyrosine phosphatase
MFDLHTHVLAGIDDGPATSAGTLAMLDRAAALGVTAMTATPHLDPDVFPSDQLASYALRVAAAIESVEALAGARGIRLTQGYEIRLTPRVADLMREPAGHLAGTSLTLGQSDAVLVELPFVGWPTWTDTALFELQAAGYVPVLAHPERYVAVQADPALAISLARRGVLLQLSLHSLVSPRREARRTAETLLRAGAIALVASDAHGDDYRLAAVTRGLERLRALVGPEPAEALAVHAPRSVLAGEATRIQASLDPRLPGRSTSLFGRLLGR